MGSNNFDRIYNAAKNKNLSELGCVRDINPFCIVDGKFCYGPVEKLAFDGEDNALDWLLKVPNYTGFYFAAIKGYARAGRTDKVNLLLEKYPLYVSEAIRGYAQAGKDKEVNELLARYPNLVGSAVLGYANAGNSAKVQSILAKHPNLVGNAILSYAQGGYTNQVNKLLELYLEHTNQAIIGYAQAGNTEQVNLLLEKNPTLRPYAVYGYALSGDFDNVNKTSQPNSDDPLFALKGFSIGGYKDQARELLGANQKDNRYQRESIKGSAISGHVVDDRSELGDLFLTYAQFGHKERVEELRKEHTAYSSNIIEGYANGTHINEVNWWLNQYPGIKGLFDSAVNGYQSSGFFRSENNILEILSQIANPEAREQFHQAVLRNLEVKSLVTDKAIEKANKIHDRINEGLTFLQVLRWRRAPELRKFLSVAKNMLALEQQGSWWSYLPLDIKLYILTFVVDNLLSGNDISKLSGDFYKRVAVETSNDNTLPNKMLAGFFSPENNNSLQSSQSFFSQDDNESSQSDDSFYSESIQSFEKSLDEYQTQLKELFYNYLVGWFNFHDKTAQSVIDDVIEPAESIEELQESYLKVYKSFDSTGTVTVDPNDPKCHQPRNHRSFNGNFFKTVVNGAKILDIDLRYYPIQDMNGKTYPPDAIDKQYTSRTFNY